MPRTLLKVSGGGGGGGGGGSYSKISVLLWPKPRASNSSGKREAGDKLNKSFINSFKYQVLLF